jgi:hypothetical protein
MNEFETRSQLAACNLLAASLTPTRRTPNMLAIRCCVIVIRWMKAGQGSVAANGKIADRWCGADGRLLSVPFGSATPACTGSNCCRGFPARWNSLLMSAAGSR